MQKITPFLWFDSQAEEAAKFYVSVFGNSRILKTVRYGKAGVEVHGTATFFIGKDPKSWMRLRVDEVIPYNEVQPSEDGKFWRCQWPGPQQAGGVMFGTTPHRTCFFGRPPGS